MHTELYLAAVRQPEDGNTITICAVALLLMYIACHVTDYNSNHITNATTTVCNVLYSSA